MRKNYNPSDPWGLLGKELSSNHCEGTKSIIIAYDHTGAIWAHCECGEEYQHDYGATWFQSEFDIKEAAEFFKEDGG